MCRTASRQAIDSNACTTLTYCVCVRSHSGHWLSHRTHVYAEFEQKNAEERGVQSKCMMRYMIVVKRLGRSSICRIERHLYVLANIDCCWTNFPDFYRVFNRCGPFKLMLVVCEDGVVSVNVIPHFSCMRTKHHEKFIFIAFKGL